MTTVTAKRGFKTISPGMTLANGHEAPEKSIGPIQTGRSTSEADVVARSKIFEGGPSQARIASSVGLTPRIAAFGTTLRSRKASLSQLRLVVIEQRHGGSAFRRLC
jgi:hypothetical protein